MDKTLIDPDGTIHSDHYVFRPRKKGYGMELWTSINLEMLPNYYIADVPSYWGLISIMFVAIRNLHNDGYAVEELADQLSAACTLYYPNDSDQAFHLHVCSSG